MSDTNEKWQCQLEEYRLLREEILYLMNKDDNLLTCLFTVVTAILFFALEWEIPEGCILSFLVIIPIGSKLAYHQKQIAKISTYMRYYLESDINIKWETFIIKLSKYQERPKTARYLKFSECLMMAIASIISYVYLIWHSDLGKEYIYVLILETGILIGLFVWTLYITKDIYSIKDYKNKYEKVMKDIQI